ncbi:MAG: carnitine dehydratase, partial [Methylococcaceae bacterium]|nr:carnitine dehydratase [Methylococcaceae bacterium]
SPVRCQISRWQDVANTTSVTENTMQAACGLMSVHGRASGKVQALGGDYISTLTSVLALQGGIAGAIGQLRGLNISDSHVSMSAAGLLSMGQYIAGATAEEMPEKLLPDNIKHPRCPPFVSKDGVIFELETLSPEPWQKFWAEIGVTSLLAGKGWNAFLLRYAKAMSPVPDELTQAIAEFDYDIIKAIGSATRVSVCPVRTLAERAKDDDTRQAWQQGAWGFQFGSQIIETPFNALNGDLPLSGLTVIESCRRIQGPLAGHMLALLGANVIRLEPIGGDPLRGMPPMAEGCSARFDALNRLKTIREVNIKSQEGKDEIYGLVETADVFLHNWAPDKAAELKLDHQDFKKINPALIYAYASGWTSAGQTPEALKSIPGTDFTTQAYSGIASKVAKNSGTNGGSLFTILDVLGGVVASQGISIALLNRCLNKVGANVSTSLLSTATLLSADDLDRHYHDKAPKTPSLINDVFPTEQGKLAIECVDAVQAEKLIQTLKINSAVSDENFITTVSTALLAKTASEWNEIFAAAGIATSVAIEDLKTLHDVPNFQTQLPKGAYTQVTSPWRFK